MRVALWLGLASGLVGCGSDPGSAPEGTPAAEKSDKAEIKLATLTPDEVQQRIDAKDGTFFAFDANGREVFDADHVPSAKWVPYDAVTADQLPADKTATLVFYCANEHCMACHKAAKSALALGYTNVYIMPAGIEGWKKAGKPVES